MSFLKRMPLLFICVFFSACAFDAGRETSNPNLFSNPTAARELIKEKEWPQGMPQPEVFRVLGMKLGLGTPNLEFMDPALVIAMVNAGFVPQGTVMELKAYREQNLADNFTGLKVLYVDISAIGYFKGFSVVTERTGFNLYLVIIFKDGGLYGAPALYGTPKLETTSTSSLGWEFIKKLPYRVVNVLLPF